MKSSIATEALYASIWHYETLRQLGNYRNLVLYYQGLAHELLELLESEGIEVELPTELEDADRLFPRHEKRRTDPQISSEEAAARLHAIKPLIEEPLPEDELARLLKALREDGFQWQPPRAV